MKSLTDKFIDKITERMNSAATSVGKKSYQDVIDCINKIEEEAEFEECARVLIKHLGTQVEKYHPHHTVIITSTSCELMEGIKCANQIMDYIQD